jgi:hypothetical protein
MTHQPDWLLNWYENGDSKNNVSDLICNILKERCKLRIAGDIHHYMRHSIAESDGSVSSDHDQPDRKPVYAQHLLVNGCGGAYVHPTHVFRNFSKSHGVSYDCKAEYPSFQTSSRVIFLPLFHSPIFSFAFNLVITFCFMIYCSLR